MFAILTALVTTLSAATLANAHGYVQDVTVDGKLFQGWHPFDDA